MAFNPYEPLPPDLEGGPVSVPISQPNQLGGVIVGKPIDPNAAIANDAQRARFATRVTTTPTVLDTQPSAAPSPAAQPGPNPIGTPGTPLMAPPTAQPSAAPTPAATPKVHPAHKAVANSIEQDIERAGQASTWPPAVTDGDAPRDCAAHAVGDESAVIGRSFTYVNRCHRLP